MKKYYAYWEMNDRDWNVIEKGNSLIQVRPQDDFLTHVEAFKERMAESRSSQHRYFVIVSFTEIK